MQFLLPSWGSLFSRKPIPDSPSSQFLFTADRRLPLAVAYTADRDSTLRQLLLPFGAAFSRKPIAKTLMQFLLLPIARLAQLSLIQQIATPHPGSYSLAFPALALDTPPGTRDWSIARDCSCPPPIGCQHLSPTDTLRALGGASSERGRKNKQGASRSTTTVRTLGSLLHLPTHM